MESLRDVIGLCADSGARLGDRDTHGYTAFAMPRPQQVAPGTYWYE